MSAILDRKTSPRHTRSSFVPDFEGTDQYEFDPFRSELEATAELDRLRPLLAEYDPHDHITDFANPSPEYGALLAKFLVYLVLAAIPAAGAALFLLPGFGC